MDWVFQCSPKRYDLASELKKGIRTEDWSMNQHRDRVSPGDRVFFWQTGPDARLLAIGRVESPVYERESPFGRYCVDIVFDYLIAPPITRPEILDRKVLSAFGPFKGQMGTNFPIGGCTHRSPHRCPPAGRIDGPNLSMFGRRAWGEDAHRHHNPARRIRSIRRTSNPRTKIDLAVR
jgi:hypothetical protein